MQLLTTTRGVNTAAACGARSGANRVLAAGFLLLLAISGFNQAALAQPYEQVAVGESHICALDASGMVDCTSTPISKRLLPPDDLPALQEITAGQQHTCGITLDGEVVCWGANAFGVLDVPQFDGPVQTLSAGRNHTCAIEGDGQVSCWGLNSNAQLDAPEGTFTALSANLSSSCGIRSNGDLQCWTTDFKFATPEPVQGPFSDLDMARNVGCALTTNGDIECWASTFGDSPEAPSNGPYTDLTVTESAVCGLTFDGLLDCSFSRFRDAEDLLAEEYPTDVAFSSIERSAERFTPTPICGIRVSDGGIQCFGGNGLPAAPGDGTSTDGPLNELINLSLNASFYSNSAVELFWNQVPFSIPAVSVEVYRNDELLITTDASYSYFDSDSIASGETRYQVRTVDQAGNVGQFSNIVVVDRDTGQVQDTTGDSSGVVNPRPEGGFKITSITLQLPLRFSTAQGVGFLRWETSDLADASVAGFQISVNNLPEAFVSATATTFVQRGVFNGCRVYSVAAISTDGEILDFRSIALDNNFRGNTCAGEL